MGCLTALGARASRPPTGQRPVLPTFLVFTRLVPEWSLPAHRIGGVLEFRISEMDDGVRADGADEEYE